jgi:hypothetical protein
LFYYDTQAASSAADAVRPPHFEGLGRSIPTDPECVKQIRAFPVAGWARIVITLTPALKIRVSFYDLTWSDQHRYPKKATSSRSTSAISLYSKNTFAFKLGGTYPWYLSVLKSTVLLQPSSLLPEPP